VRVLVDTHALLWALDKPRRLPKAVRQLLEAGGTEILVSAATAWELGIKHHKGKLPEAQSLLANWDPYLNRLGAVQLPITHAHARLAAALNWEHNDPFDRMLAAQAITESLPLISADQVFDQALGLRRWWDRLPD